MNPSSAKQWMSQKIYSEDCARVVREQKSFSDCYSVSVSLDEGMSKTQESTPEPFEVADRTETQNPTQNLIPISERRN